MSALQLLNQLHATQTGFFQNGADAQSLATAIRAINRGVTSDIDRVSDYHKATTRAGSATGDVHIGGREINGAVQIDVDTAGNVVVNTLNFNVTTVLFHFTMFSAEYGQVVELH